MSSDRFLPEHLRPRPTGRRRRRRGALLLVLLPALLALIPRWPLQAVEVEGREHLPPAMQSSLAELPGTPVAALDLHRLRQQLQCWPSVAAVDLRLSFGGTLHVRVQQATPVASLRWGRGWHGITREGHFSGPLTHPMLPILEAFPGTAQELRDALRASQRVARASGAGVRSVRRVTPEDYELTLEGSLAAPARVRVRPEGSAAEERWCALYAVGRAPGPWVDLRFEDRLVVAAQEVAG